MLAKQTQCAAASRKASGASFWVALGLDVLGVAIIYAGYMKHKDMWDAYDRYKEIGPNSDDWNYSDPWEKAEYNHASRNILYVIGGLVLASGIGVHIWF